jgi:hypothetical protein
LESLRAHKRTGRPLGDERFIAKLEGLAGPLLHRQKSGPKSPGKEIVMYGVPGTLQETWWWEERKSG